MSLGILPPDFKRNLCFYSHIKTHGGQGKPGREQPGSPVFLFGNTPEKELIVQVLNMNVGCNEALKAQCQNLKEYIQYVDKVRFHAGYLPIEEAVNRAVDECIEQGILRKFLLANRN